MMRRMWINQPSTLQPLHHLHGTRVLAEGRRVYFLDGETISMEVPGLVLSAGWPQHLMPAKLADMPLSWGCLEEAHAVVWAAIESIPEGALSDDDRDQLNTAMAWLKEAAEEYPG